LNNEAVDADVRNHMLADVSRGSGDEDLLWWECISHVVYLQGKVDVVGGLFNPKPSDVTFSTAMSLTQIHTLL
jgi:hypothetical protein